VIYLIKDGQYIKIGTTIKTAIRLTTLQTGNPRRIAIIAIMHGGETEERLLHRRFARLRVLHRREWFKLSWWHVGFVVCHLNAQCCTKYAQRCKALYKALFWLNPF